MPDDESLSDYQTIKPREFGTQIKRTIALEHSKIKNVQKEVLDAVADLDKPSNTFTDPEPKETKALENKEETSSTPNKAKKDALNNLP
jgi:hypothetical protein